MHADSKASPFDATGVGFSFFLQGSSCLGPFGSIPKMHPVAGMAEIGENAPLPIRLRRNRIRHAFDGLSSDRNHARGGVLPTRGGDRVVEVEEWNAISNALGEALLDVERTFLDVVERQASQQGPLPRAAPGQAPVKAYLDAWSKLDEAHRALARLLTDQGHLLHLMSLRCGQCSQELR